LYCEVCGREIVGRPARALVEGATMVVCNQCAGLGTALPSLPDRPRPRAPGMSRSRTPAPRLPLEKLPREVEESELLEEFPKIVKQAREKLGISQQELAIKAKEKLTVIQKIEIGKISPTMRLAIVLEHILHITLMAPRKDVEIPNPPVRQTGDTGATLGDIALVRHKENHRAG